MRKIICCAILFLCFSSAWSQARRNVSAFQIRANAYPVGVDIELADSDFKTINVSFGVMGSLSTVGNEDGAELAFGFAPYVDMQYRWFYKLKHEAKQGMKLRGNSGNFLAFRAEAKSKPMYDVLEEAPSRFAVGAVWGLQRQYVTGFHLGFEIGFGYALSESAETGFVPMGNIKIGWLIADLN